MCSRHEQLPHVVGIGPQLATTNVLQRHALRCPQNGPNLPSRKQHHMIALHDSSRRHGHSFCGGQIVIHVCFCQMVTLAKRAETAELSLSIERHFATHASLSPLTYALAGSWSLSTF